MPRKNSDQTGRDEVPPTVGMFSSDEMEKAPDGARGPRQRKAKPKEDPKAEYGPSPTEPDSSKPDPFDPKRFRIDPQNKEALAQRVWTDGQIAIRKPNDQEWFRVRTGVDPEGEPWIMPETPILQRRADGKYRLLTPDIAPAVKQAKLVTLRFCITVEGTPLIWPIPEPGPDGRDNAYWETARGIAVEAEANWMHMWADQKAGRYLSERAPKDYGDGKWGSTPATVRHWLRIGFSKDGVIDNLEHPELKKLRGEL
jgi:hypothetical protein